MYVQGDRSARRLLFVGVCLGVLWELNQSQQNVVHEVNGHPAGRVYRHPKDSTIDHGQFPCPETSETSAWVICSVTYFSCECRVHWRHPMPKNAILSSSTNVPKRGFTFLRKTFFCSLLDLNAFLSKSLHHILWLLTGRHKTGGTCHFVINPPFNTVRSLFINEENPWDTTRPLDISSNSSRRCFILPHPPSKYCPSIAHLKCINRNRINNRAVTWISSVRGS